MTIEDMPGWLVALEGVRLVLQTVAAVLPARRRLAPTIAGAGLAQLAPGTVIGGTFADGSTWFLRVPAVRSAPESGGDQ